MKNILGSAVLGLCCLGFAAAPVRADDNAQRAGREAQFQRGSLQLDQRHNHDRYYPRHGTPVARIPQGSVLVAHGPEHYYFHRGVWFRPVGHRYVVFAPPFGIVVPMLPASYVTLQFGGRPYFYANGVYYAAATGPGYVVVAPPSGIETLASGAAMDSAAAMPANPMPAAAPGQALTPTPRNGQSAEQNIRDIGECNQWANAQSAVAGDASAFQRSFAACMDSRGYTLR